MNILRFYLFIEHGNIIYCSENVFFLGGGGDACIYILFELSLKCGEIFNDVFYLWILEAL